MRRRNMFNITGQPGWMRLGYSPGWVGRRPSGLGPCAQLLMEQQNAASTTESQQATTNSEIQFLMNRAKILEQNLNAIKTQIESLKGAEDQ